MDPATLIWIALLMGLAAALYSSVGHGGASAYLAIMALFAVAPETMRPTALALNLVVAGFGALRYWLAGQINLRLLLAFVVTAAPGRLPRRHRSSSRPNITGRWSACCSGWRRSACSGSRRGSPSSEVHMPSLVGHPARPAPRSACSPG